jgi:dipeptidyl aminopeptidase/acylaminoacyl peptidase
VWSVKNGTEVARLVGHIGPIAAARFSPDGRRIATAGDDQTAKIWELPSGRVAMALEGHGAAVRHVLFNADGSLVATAGADGLVNLWDARTGRLARSLRHVGEVLALDFSKDEPLLVAGSNGGNAAKLWDLRPETRDAGEIMQVIAAGSAWRVRNGVLLRGDDPTGPPAFAAAVGREPSAVTLQRDAPDETILAFLTALEHGDTARVRDLVGPNARSTAQSLLDATADQLREYVGLFKGARIINTIFRNDRLFAMTMLDTPARRIAVWTEKNGGLWKLVDFRGASPSK